MHNMRIIQSFNTFSGFRLTGGFADVRSLLEYLNISYNHHISITNDYIFYTDEYGAGLVKNIINNKHIEIIEFPNVLRGKLIFEGKFFVQSLQNKEYIHVDLDATLFSIPEHADCYFEKIRPMVYLGREANQLNIKHDNITSVPCSALIGFSDIDFQKKYLFEVFKRFEIIQKIPKCTYTHAYTLEEILLQRLIIDNNKELKVCDCEHLGNLK